MKDSGIEWIGQIPDDWKIVRLKYYLTRRTIKNHGNSQVLSLYREFGIIPKDSRDDNHNVTSEDTSKYLYVRSGDFVVNKMKAWQGSVAVSSYYGIVSPAYFVYEFKDNSYYKKYFHYLLRNKLYAFELMRLSGGIRVGQWDLSSYEFEHLYLYYPPLSIQHQIADFLDRKCSKIDSIISNLTTQIKELQELKKSIITETVLHGLDNEVEMKDSSIEWIGEIPSHWKINRLKYVAELSPYCDFSKITNDSVIEYLPMEFIRNGYYIPNTKKYCDIPKSLTPFKSGDIVFAKVTPCFENGNIAILNNLSSNIGLGSSELYVLRVKYIECSFMFYYIQSHGFMSKAVSTMTGMGGLKRISSKFVCNAYVPIPPLPEQQQIADYLDNKCSKIDNIIEKKQQQLNYFEEYKKSLIFEYTTGKKRVDNNG